MSRVISRTAIALAIVAVAGIAEAAETMTGAPRIMDGDTVDVAGTRIRLQGIDTRETNQVCFTATGEHDLFSGLYD
jgi:endonuclease YncB( thermonuclease family)